VLIHLLAFFETPSSLTLSSDLRHVGTRVEAPCGLLHTLELLCLSALLADVIIKVQEVFSIRPFGHSI